MIPQLQGRLTLSVPEAGELIFGLGRDASYRAADRGEIPSRRVGRSRRVPTYEALRAVGVPDDVIQSTLGVLLVPPGVKGWAKP